MSVEEVFVIFKFVWYFFPIILCSVLTRVLAVLEDSESSHCSLR